MHPRVSALLIAVGAVVALASCGDLTAVKARFPNRSDSLRVFAINGTPSTVPTALAVRAMFVLRAGPDFGFDIAFDITDTGTVKLLTARSLSTELAGVMNRIGLRTTPLAFDAILEAPTTEYVYDSVLVVPVGRTVLVDIIDLNCQSEAILGLNIRAKMVVDSIHLAEREIFLRLLTNRNCGFRSLVGNGELPTK